MREYIWAAVFLASLAAACSEDGAAGTPATTAPDAGSDAADDAADSGSPAALLDPATIPKFTQPLVVPPVMPPASTANGIVEYHIAARQFQQQVLPPGLPMTTVWGYGREGDPLPGTSSPSTFNFPSFTVETRVNQVVRVKWVNGLLDSDGNYLPHLLPLDPTLHWASPMGTHEDTPSGPYDGPVPIVTHVHGAHVADQSDGYPEAWYLPDAVDLPAMAAIHGARYASVVPTDPGAAIFEYPNDVRPTTLWFHDHALGITRLNVYAGLAGFWLVRDAAEDALGLPGPAPQLNDAPGTRYFEIPIAIQDRKFREDGSLYYPGSRAEFDDYEGPYLPDTPIHPIWNPEFFGDVMVVNGRSWPLLEVEPRLYRFRFLNGCDSRFLILAMDKQGLTFHQIGAEGGLLSTAPAAQQHLLIAPGERADVLVDFSALSEGDEVILQNVGPDEPFNGMDGMVASDPATTGQVMKLKVVASTSAGTAGAIPTQLPVIAPLTTTLPPRDLTLNEIAYMPLDIPVEAMLGTAAKGPLEWDATITETPTKGSTEVWRIINLTADAHPIHLHLVTFQVLDRTPMRADDYKSAQDAFLNQGATEPVLEDFFDGAATSPEPSESGWKDTVIAYPGQVTRIIANFDKEGLYIWHCHILSHEDNEMMRPFQVLPAP